jgi:integrase
VLGRDLGTRADVVRARRPERLPVVLNREEVRAILARLRGSVGLMARLMYGAGLRLLECAELRVKDLDITAHEVRVRDGKGRKDRVTMLPAAVVEALVAHLVQVKRLHQQDLAGGQGWVAMPDALGRKYPNAGKEWAWQWVFPATRMYHDEATGQRRRHHLHESVMQRAFKAAVVQSGVTKRATCHTLRSVSA